MARLCSTNHFTQTAAAGTEYGTAGIPASWFFSSTNIPYPGSYSLLLSAAATAPSFTLTCSTGDDTNKAMLSGLFRLESLPSINANLFIWRDSANNNRPRIQITTTGLPRINTQANVVIQTGTALSLNTWYWCEFDYDCTVSPATVAARFKTLDGTLVQTLSGSDTAASTYNYNRVLIGPASSSTWDIRYGPIIINDNTGSSQNTNPGQQRLHLIKPIGAGDSNSWLNTAGGAGSVNNWFLTSEIVPDSTTSVVQSVTLNNADLYRLAPITPSPITSSDTITCVELSAQHRNNSAADATTEVKLQIEKVSGGTKLLGRALIPNSTTARVNTTVTNNVYPALLYAYNDPDGNPWSLSTLRSMQAGPKITTAGVQRIQISTLWGYISYIHNPIARTAASARTNIGSTRSAASTRTATSLRQNI